MARFIQMPADAISGNVGLRAFESTSQRKGASCGVQLSFKFPFSSQEVLDVAARLRSFVNEIDSRSKKWFVSNNKEIDSLILKARDIFYDRELCPPMSLLLARTTLSRIVHNRRRSKKEKELFSEEVRRFKAQLVELASSLEKLA